MYFPTYLRFEYEYPINEHPQKEIFHKTYNFSVYTASKYWDLKLDTYRQITPYKEVSDRIERKIIK